MDSSDLELRLSELRRDLKEILSIIEATPKVSGRTTPRQREASSPTPQTIRRENTPAANPGWSSWMMVIPGPTGRSGAASGEPLPPVPAAASGDDPPVPAAASGADDPPVPAAASGADDPPVPATPVPTPAAPA